MSKASTAEQLLTEYGSAVELDFVRSPSGKVHIPMPDKPDWARDEDRILERWSEAAEIATTRTRMVCGLTRFVARLGVGKYEPISEFADGDLCVRCVRGLGSESPRAFEHPQPDETVAH